MIIFAHDYETTGVKAASCGVVQAALCFAKLYNDGSYEILTQDVQLLNPCEPIPAGASGVHGIYDHHVAAAPHYDEYLAEQFEVVNDTAIEFVAGYNSKRFDDVIARRLGLAEYPALDLFVAASRFNSMGVINGAKLTNAYEGLTGRKAENAHDAFADIVMTLDLIKPAIEAAKCDDVAGLIEWMDTPWSSPKMKMPFGKHKGVKVCNLPKDYVRWALENMTLNADLKSSLEMVQ